jgi:hypothetical protein
MKWTFCYRQYYYSHAIKENQRSTIVNDTLITIPEITTVIKDEKPEIHLPKQYSNERFKVTVERIDEINSEFAEKGKSLRQASTG